MNIKKKTGFLVYILNCVNGGYYSGYTNNLIKRYDDHIRGRASKFTRGFKPLGIAQCWCAIENKSEALKIEYYIKSLPKLKKTELIVYPEILMEKFDCVPLLYARIKHYQLYNLKDSSEKLFGTISKSKYSFNPK